jgi:hypothetical protein
MDGEIFTNLLCQKRIIIMGNEANGIEELEN